MLQRISRQRKWRERQRHDRFVVPAEIDFAIVDALIDLGWLIEEDAADRDLIGAAIARALSDLATSRK